MDPVTARAIEETLAEFRKRPEKPAGILPVLLKIEEVVGNVPRDSVTPVARALGVTEAQVAGVLSYYPDLRTSPPGSHLVRVCLGEACLANRGGRVLRAVQDQLRVEIGETTTDGRWTLEKVYCVGNCGVSPTVVIDDVIHGRMTPEQVPGMLERDR